MTAVAQECTGTDQIAGIGDIDQHVGAAFMQQAQADDAFGNAVDTAAVGTGAKYRLALRMTLLGDQRTEDTGMIAIQLRPVTQGPGPAGPASGTVARIARCAGLHPLFPFAAKGPRPAPGGPPPTPTLYFT